MRSRVLKFALSGAHGTGKTTLASRLAQDLESKLRLAITPEVPRLIIQEVGDPLFFRRGQNTFERQCLILARQLEVEYQAAYSEVEVVICDRTLIDHWAYTRYLFPGQVRLPEGALWQSLVLRWARSNYDDIVRLPPEFPPLDDGVREDSKDFQAAIDAEICNLYAAAGVELGAARGSIEERVEFCANRILRRVNKHDN